MKVKLLCVLVCLCLLLTGCLYPDREKKMTTVVSKESIRNVQAAVEEYLSDNSIYPIVGSNQTQFKALNMRIDLQKLQREYYIDSIPNAAYEKNGIFYYVIYEYDDIPMVKAFEINTAYTVSSYQEIVFDYIIENYRLPAVKEIISGFYTIDYDLLKAKIPQIQSPFTQEPLELIVSDTGQVYVNYMKDIMNFIQSYGNEESYSDLNEILIINSDFVPVKSPLYKFENNIPVPYEVE